MAVSSTAVWRVRPGGNNANGAGYDAGISGAGTDYSQQDAAQASVTNLAATSGSTTVTSSSNPFTSAMVGNAIRISSGTNATAGFYFITAYTSASTVTLDRTPTSGGAMSGASAKVGGGVATIDGILGSSLSAVGAVGGNTVYIRGSGSDSPSTADYTAGGYVNCYGGATVGAPIKIRAENGRPRIDGNYTIYDLSYVDMRGLMFVATGSTYAAYNSGLISVSHSIVRDCVFNGAGYDICMAAIDYSVFIENELYHPVGGTVGTNGNSALAGGRLSIAAYNNFHDLVTPAMTINDNYDCTFMGNIVANGLTDGVVIQNSNYGFTVMTNNTITGNAGNGINLLATDSGFEFVSIFGNLIANHTGTGKAGIAFAGTQSSNDAGTKFVNGNAFYNNSAHVSGLTSIGDLSVALSSDPFVGVSTENLTLASGVTQTLPSKAFMQRNSGKTTGLLPYQGPGAVATPASAGGLTVTRPEIYNVA